jgi:hypothetical protein
MLHDQLQVPLKRGRAARSPSINSPSVEHSPEERPRVPAADGDIEMLPPPSLQDTYDSVRKARVGDAVAVEIATAPWMIPDKDHEHYREKKAPPYVCLLA